MPAPTAGHFDRPRREHFTATASRAQYVNRVGAIQRHRLPFGTVVAHGTETLDPMDVNPPLSWAAYPVGGHRHGSAGSTISKVIPDIARHAEHHADQSAGSRAISFGKTATTADGAPAE